MRAGDGKNTIIGRLAVATQHVSGIATPEYESNGKDLLNAKTVCASSANYNTYCFVVKTIALHLAFRSTRGAEKACMLGAAPAGYCFDVEAFQTINTLSVPTHRRVGTGSLLQALLTWPPISLKWYSAHATILVLSRRNTCTPRAAIRSGNAHP